MMGPRRFHLSIALAIALAAPALPHAASAAEPALGADCSSAGATMAKMMPQSAAPKPGADLDKEYATGVLELHKAMLAMAKLELRCGTGERAKAQAKKILELPPSYFENLELIQHTG